MRFSPSFLEEIRDRIPIADVIGRRVTFDRKKSNPAKGDYWACCPFHGEKTPSFHCENQKGRYHCFGCGASGDHFRFLTELDGLSFPEAVELLADEAGVAMPAVDPQAAQRAEQRASLHDVMEMAASFFRNQLQTAEGAKARSYLRDRGLSAQVQQEFGIGYAPSSRSALKEHLGSKGVEREKIEACGLVVFGPDIPVSYDRFRDRIMFPILDVKGRCIAFGGRALSADVPAKYLNSPETDLFSKSNVLYNYAKARKATERGEGLIVVEGYMDVIALAAAGFENAVAPLGTALTEQQLALAWKVGGAPILCFDGDDAGARAAGRALDTILPQFDDQKTARFVVLPQGQDPDDYLRINGADTFRQLLTNAMPASEYLIHRHVAGATLDTLEDKIRVEKAIIRDVSTVNDPQVKQYLRDHVRTRLAGLFHDRDVVAVGPIGAQLSEVKAGTSMREKLILGICVEFPILLARHIDTLMEVNFNDKRYALFQLQLQKLLIELKDYSVSEIYSLIPEQFYEVLNEIHGQSETRPSTSTEPWSLRRGHRLRQNFPMMASDPPVELVERFLLLLFRQIEEREMEVELRVFSQVDDTELYLRQLEDLRLHQQATQAMTMDLDRDFRVHAGRESADFWA
ncbi:MAG: DNA primase [Ahrensia sp.]|nr:DNA primase [Ahrensia sp.]